MDNEQGLAVDNIESAIEAILFAAGHPMTYAKIGEVLGVSEGQIKKKTKKYADSYNSQKNRGVILLTFENSAQLCTKEQYLGVIKEALGIRKGGNLSASSLEVLAIIAYNEPVTRAFVDLVRKVDSAYIMNSLLEKNLIEICGRLDVPGRPNLYKTTPTFLRCFGIETLEQLPYVDLPRAQNEGEIIPLDVEIPKEKTDNDDSDEQNSKETEKSENPSEAENTEISNDKEGTDTTENT